MELLILENPTKAVLDTRLSDNLFLIKQMIELGVPVEKIASGHSKHLMAELLVFLLTKEKHLKTLIYSPFETVEDDEI